MGFFLERIKSVLDGIERAKINRNFDKIEKNFNNVVEVVSERAYSEVVDAAKLLWLEPVPTFADLAITYPNAVEGNTVMAREVVNGVNKVYRYNGSEWKEIQQISADAVNEVDERLSEQLSNFEQMKNFDLSSRWRKQQAGVCITLDDGGIHDLLTVMPILRDRGLVASTGIITDNIGNPNFPLTMTWSQVSQLDEEGWEIASHSKGHAILPDLNDDDLINELKGSLDVLKARGYDTRNLFLPYGRMSDKVKEFAKRYYRSMRVSGAASTGKRLNYSPFDMYRIDSMFFGDTTGIGNRVDTISGFEEDTVDYFKYYIDKAIAEKAMLCIGIHGNNIAQFNRQNDLAEIADYIAQKAKNKEIVTGTYNECLNMMGNLVDTNNFKLGANGKIGGKYGKIQLLGPNEIKGTTPIVDIEEGYLTINAITPGYPEGLPVTGGVLSTMKTDDLLQRAYQILAGLNGGGLYYRGFSVDGTPTNFRRLDNVLVYNDFALPPNHRLEDLTFGCISYYTILTSNATGYPGNAPGILMANRVSSNSGGCFEEYRLLWAESRTYKRKWVTETNSWSEWIMEIDIRTSSVNAYTLTDNIDTYPMGISYCPIQRVHAQTHGFPEGLGGTLETHRILTAGWVYQNYTLHNSPKTYKRVWRDDNTWSNFVVLGGG